MKLREIVISVVLSATVIVLSSSTALGGLLGYSYEECVTKLGEPESQIQGTKSGVISYRFIKGDWIVVTSLIDRRIHAVVYRRLDNAPLTMVELDRLLEGYGEGYSWQKQSQGFYTRSDNQVQAGDSQNGVVIYTDKFLRVGI